MKTMTFFFAFILGFFAVQVNSQPLKQNAIRNPAVSPFNTAEKSHSYLTRSTNPVHTKSINYLWDGISWNYVGNSKYNYNAAGMATHILLTDTTKSLKLTQVFYNYDNYNNSTGVIYMNWNTLTSKWDTLDTSYPSFSTRYLYQYDASNRITQKIYQNWSSGWQNISKEDYILNVTGKYTQITVYDWSGTNWIPNYTDSLCTWVGDQLASFIEKIPNNNGGWQNDKIYSSTFTSAKDYIAWYDNYNDSGMVGNYLRFIKTYNAYGGDTNVEAQYIAYDSTWENAYRSLYYIDSLGNYYGYRYDQWYMASYWLQYDGTYIAHAYDANQLMLSETLSAYSTTTDTLELQEKHVFSEFKIPPVTSLKESTSSGNIKIYPNPASDCVFIDIKGNDKSNTTINLYDINGRLILNRVINKNEITVKIDLNDFKAGTYLIEAGNEKEVSHSRLLIK